ncbi:uncharacterized protein DS421_1g16580 [Arachis hypogaea]|nr:uncharacterized protein DS421_1g16580 [Arachis hypogaea]
MPQLRFSSMIERKEKQKVGEEKRGGEERERTVPEGVTAAAPSCRARTRGVGSENEARTCAGSTGVCRRRLMPPSGGGSQPPQGAHRCHPCESPFPSYSSMEPASSRRRGCPRDRRRRWSTGSHHRS